MEIKKCCTCKVEYPANSEYYHKHKSQPDGFSKTCKTCTKTRKARYYANNKEKVNAKNLENYYKNNPKETIDDGYKRCCMCKEIKTIDQFGKSSKSKDGLKYSCIECRKVEYQNNRSHNMKRSKEYYNQHKKAISKLTKGYRESNQEWKRAIDKKYYLENSDKIKERSKRYLYNRIETDTGFKILQRCRSRLYKAVKGYVKSARTKELIGCNVEQLLEHLENQFTEGMTWENYGEWHIDHIIPCSSFDFNIKENQFKCFNYTNLQPLWAEENFKKNNKISIQ